MKTLLQPKVLIPLILSVALLVALLAFVDLKKVVALIEGFQKIYLLWFLLLMMAYEVVRGAQWYFLLRALDIRVPLRTQIFAFAGGEVTKSMPIGNYFQNYLLQQSKGSDFGRTSAATTVIIILEVVVSLTGVVILGLGAGPPGCARSLSSARPPLSWPRGPTTASISTRARRAGSGSTRPCAKRWTNSRNSARARRICSIPACS